MNREARARGRATAAKLIEEVGYAEALRCLCFTISHAKKDYVAPHFYDGAKEAMQAHRERTPLT